MVSRNDLQRYRYAGDPNLPTIRDVRPVDPVLTDMSVGFKNERFLWDMIAPVKSTDERSGTYMIYTRDYWFRRLEGAERPETGDYTRVGYGIGTGTYTTGERGFEKVLGDPTRAASQTPEDLQTVDVQFLTNLIQLELEVVAAGALFITGIWGTSNTLTGVNQWSDFANSDPIADADTALRTIRRNTGETPNRGFVGLLGWERLKEHPLILDKYKHVNVGIMTPALVAAVLGVDEIIVGDSVQNTAAENAAFVGADIWTDNMLFSVTKSPALMTGTGAVTFMWDEGGSVPWGIDSYRDEVKRANVTRVRTNPSFQIISAQHGYLFLDVAA